jgi:hypothetical protein
LYLEKYSTEKNKISKKTYMLIPADHPKYPFPYNLEDRISFYEDLIKTDLSFKSHNLDKTDKNIVSYYVEFTETKKTNIDEAKKIGFIKQDKNKWSLTVT